MHLLQLLLCLAVVCVQGALLGPEPRSATPTDGDKSLAPGSAGVLDSVLRGTGKSRQSRCVRCYEDRYYSGGSSGSGSGSDRYGGYSSRAGDDPRSSWYYSYDRYDDRGGSGSGRDRDRDRDYDRYYSRDERYSPRTYDRYEGRGYDDYYRRGASYDRGSGSGYGYASSSYDSRDRYYGDRYSDSSRDRYYDRSRSSYDRYDPYDRYYSRYDFRNYRPWDETYRGQSGFDNSGRGYYFAGDDDDRRSMPQSYYDRERAQSPASAPVSPCGHLIANCPYGGTKVSSSAIDSDGYRGGHTSVMGQPTGQGSWTYLGDQDKQSSRGGGSGSNGGSGSSSGVGGGSSSAGAVGSGSASGGSGGGGGGSGMGRDRERDAQSSSYGGRPRPLGGSYLFDRDSNAVPESPSDAANSTGDGGNGSAHMPAAAAQTAPKPDESSAQGPEKKPAQ